MDPIRRWLGATRAADDPARTGQAPPIDTAPAAGAPPGSPAEPEAGGGAALAALGGEVWRLRQRLERADPDRVAAMRGLWNSVGRLEQALADASVEVDDPIGRAYDPRSTLEVIHSTASAPGPGTAPGAPGAAGAGEAEAALWIVETIAPVVRVGGRVVRHGQVVVGPGAAGATRTGPAAAGAAGEAAAGDRQAGTADGADGRGELPRPDRGGRES